MDYVYKLRQKVDPLGNAGESIKIEQLLGVCGGLGAGPFADMITLRSKDASWDSALNALYSVLNEQLPELSANIADDKQLFYVLCNLYNEAYLLTKEEYDAAVSAKGGGGKRYKQRGGNFAAVMGWVLGPFTFVFNLTVAVYRYTGGKISTMLDWISSSQTVGAIVNRLTAAGVGIGGIPQTIDAYYANIITNASPEDVAAFIILMAMSLGLIPSIALSGLISSVLALLPLSGTATTMLYIYLQYINYAMIAKQELIITSKILRYVKNKIEKMDGAIKAKIDILGNRFNTGNIEDSATKIFKGLYKKLTGKDYDPNQTVTYTILKADMSKPAIVISGISPGIYSTALSFASNNPARIRITKPDKSYTDQAPDPRGGIAAASSSNASGNQGGGSRRKHKSRRHSRRAHRKTHKHVRSTHQRKSSHSQRR
jgi:hypothetical protein